MIRKFSLLLVITALVTACATPEKETKIVIAYPPAPDEPRFYYERTLRGSADVKVETLSAFRKALTGETETSDRFVKPFDVVARDGRVYVSDSATKIVHVLDFPNGKYWKIGAGQLSKPLGMNMDAAGNLYVSDVTNAAVFVYDKDGKPLKIIGGKEYFNRPSSVAVTPDGSKVYIVDTGGVSSSDHRVRVFDGITTEHLFDIGTRGNAPGEFNLPREADIGPDGRLYVVDGGNFRVQVFEQDGTFVQTFGQVGRRTGQFSRPKGIATDSSGNIYVADAAFGNFQIFNSEGQLLMFVGQRGMGGPGQFMLPSGIGVDEDGRVYFVDQFVRKVDVFRPAGLKETEGALARVPKSVVAKPADEKKKKE